jgi:hypothetical protein
MNNRAKKNLFYALAYLCGYVAPFLYFFIKYGLFQKEERMKILFPIVLIVVLGIVRVAIDIPQWVSTWEPSFLKGIVKAIPKLLLFIFFVTFGLSIKYIAEKSLEIAFYTYFETVFVIFGGLCIGAIFEAYHLKYKELYLISKGYVLGVVNR